MKRFAAVLLILSLAITCFAVYKYKSESNQKITEDDPRWDCKTMGNKICGPKIELEPLHYVSHKGHFDAISIAGVVLSEFETFEQLQAYASENGFALVKGKPSIYCGARTKNGAACKRRVKNAGERCYQHKGK